MDHMETRLAKEGILPPPPPPSKLEKRMNLMEEQLLLTRGDNIHRKNSRPYQPIVGVLSETLSFVDLPKFQGAGDLVNHLTAYK